ncbi:hypothetical protein B5S31_g5006 [[Candida] boidinii]|nr:hypothetical protein B5S29_g4521 [[Candida] boidinii]OWB75147.1 hypothetical protein B5S31_g5006 [[Candida] boidinii]OWB79384.1 hypothetical protein B5S32_g3605 [[Candida] boidinii]GMF06511.1 unnamed protein product [[Candida] boidinii]
MPDVKRTIRVTTTQHILKDVAPVQEGFPMRQWSIQITLLNESGKELPATIFEKVTYHLHPTFANPVRTFKKLPFKIEEQGWGGFDMTISLTLLEKGGERKIQHDLNFNKEKYIIDHIISIPTTKQNLNKELIKSGSVPGFTDPSTSSLSAAATPSSSSNNNTDTATNNNNNKSAAGTPGATSTIPAVSAATSSTPQPSTTSSKRKNGNSNENTKGKKLKAAAIKGDIDLEKLADGLTKLTEDDLLGVVQMVNDNRTPDMSIKNDVDNGEFTMDLFTLPDTLLKSLWEYVKKRIN